MKEEYSEEWNDALRTAKAEFGFNDYEYVSRDYWDDIVKTAKQILSDNYYDCHCEKYDRYLKSNEWKKICKKVLYRDQDHCLDCGKIGNQVHHLNYDNLYNEKIEDLITVCEDCHKQIHETLQTEKHLQTVKTPQTLQMQRKT